MADVSLPGPDSDPLTKKEAADYLRLSGVRGIDRLVKEGLLPPGILLGSRGPLIWRAADLAAYLWLQGRGCKPGTTTEKIDDGDEE
jgi:hypothetical protein